MKFGKLTIRNLASIEKAEIDFEKQPLKGEPLFLLCGDTGAGKTTILDAICLALFCKTPRYDAEKAKKGEAVVGTFKAGDLLQLVRHGASEAEAALELMGNDGVKYRARWMAEAYKNNTAGHKKGELKSSGWEWKNLKTGESWDQVRACEEVAARAVGMDFTQFCRTSMLAQGEFTKFLEADPDDKAQILEKLTDTRRFAEIGKRIAETAKAKKKLVEDAQNELNGRLAGLSAEERDKKKAELKQVKDDLARVEGDLKKANEDLAACQKFDEAQNSIQKASNELEKLKDTYRQLKCGEAYLLQEKASKAKEQEELQKKIQQQEHFKTTYEQVDLICQLLADVKDAESGIQECENKVGRLKGELPAKEQAVHDAEAAFNVANANVVAKQKEVDLADACCKTSDIAALRDRDSRLRKLISDVRDLGNERERRGALANEIQTLGSEINAKELELPCLEDAERTAREELDIAEKEFAKQKSLIDDGIEKLVANLHVGEKCPVCGNMIEKLAVKDSFRSLYEELRKKCDEHRQKYNDASKELSGKREEIRIARTSLKQKEDEDVLAADGRIELLEKKISTDGEGLGLQEYSESACENAIQEVNGKIGEYDDRYGMLMKLREELTSCKESRGSAESAHTQAKISLENHKKDIQTAETTETRWSHSRDGKLQQVRNLVAIDGWELEWREHSEVFCDELKRAATEYVDNSRTDKNLENEIKGIERDVSLARQQFVCIQNMTGWAHEGVITPVERQNLHGDVSRLYGDVCTHMSTIKNAKDTINQTDARIKAMGDEDRAKLSERIKELSDLSGKLNERKGALRQVLEDDEKKAKERRNKETELESLQKDAEQWNVLDKMFGSGDGKKLRGIVQSYVLGCVLVRANEYLKNLTSRYELSRVGLTLTVRDSLGTCHERPVQTLSGGEKFLISLALALGLAGMNDAALSADILFIDEGFGTLSGEHLGSVMDALGQLNSLTGSRQVGIISHVEALRNRIRTKIEVKRDGSNPSTVAVTSHVA